MADAFVTMVVNDSTQTFVIKSTHYPDAFFMKATQSDLSIGGSDNKCVLDTQTLRDVVPRLADLVEVNAELTAHALVVLSGGDVDPEIVLEILKTGTWPAKGNPAEEAAAFAHHLLKAGREALDRASAVVWEYRGDLYGWHIGPRWDFWHNAPDELTVEAIAQALWRVTASEVTTQIGALTDGPPERYRQTVTLSSKGAKIDCFRTFATPDDPAPHMQRVEVDLAGAATPFATKLATYSRLRSALMALGCFDPMSRARARAAAQEAAARIEAPMAAMRAAAIVSGAAMPSDITRQLEKQFARARQAGAFETYYDMWQHHGEQHASDTERAQMEADRVGMANERVESKAAVEALVTSLRSTSPGEVERWADAHIAYLRAFIEDCIGAGEGELSAASSARLACDKWAQLRDGALVYVDENPNHVTPNHDRYARLFGLHYQTLEPIDVTAYSGGSSHVQS